MANGLDASIYSKWIKSEDIRFTEDLKELFEFYVLGTPAFNLSSRGRCLYTYYGYKEINEYDTLLKALTAGISYCEYSDTYENLKNLLLSSNCWLGFSDFPITTEEAIAIYCGEYTKNYFFINYFKPTASPVNPKGITNNQRKEATDSLRHIVYVERIMYHIRNSLAHGLFCLVEKDDEHYYIFQDTNKNQLISARMILKISTLKRWIKILTDNRDK